MAVPALRIALGQLPPGSVPALAAVLRPEALIARRSCATALAVAATHQLQGTPAGSVLAAAAGRAFLRVSRHAPPRQNATLTDALALAARQQPQGTLSAKALAAASGRAFLRMSGGFTQLRARAVAGSALALAAGRLSPECAAAIAPASRQQLACFRRRRKSPPSSLPARSPREPPKQQSSLPNLCQDTSNCIFGQLWPAKHVSPLERCSGQPEPAAISPRTFETRLRMSKPLFSDLGRVAAVSPTWAQHAERDGWPSTHAYLFQEPGTKWQLQERYSHSIKRLRVKDWLQDCGSQAPFSVELQGDQDGVMSRIVAFLP